MSLINFLTRVHFADRVLEDALPVELARLGLRRVLLVSDAAGAADEPAQRLQALLAGECEVTQLQTMGRGEPDAALLAEIEADGVIGFGGPAALCLALQAGSGRWRGGRLLPVIAVPTTSAGVGILPPGQGGDGGLGQTSSVPSVILCDPTLTLWAGAETTVAASLEALSGCIESYLSSAWNPPADGIALDGIARIVENLGRAAKDEQDIEARRQLLAAALNAGLAGQKGRGAAAALVRALLREPQIAAAPGTLHAALLPAVLRFNVPAVGARLKPLTKVLQLQPGIAADQGLAAFLRRHGQDAPLSSFGLRKEQIERLARRAVEDPSTGSNPRLAAEEDYRGLLEGAF